MRNSFRSSATERSAVLCRPSRQVFADHLHARLQRRRQKVEPQGRQVHNASGVPDRTVLWPSHYNRGMTKPQPSCRPEVLRGRRIAPPIPRYDVEINVLS